MAVCAITGLAVCPMAALGVIPMGFIGLAEMWKLDYEMSTKMEIESAAIQNFPHQEVYWYAKHAGIYYQSFFRFSHPCLVTKWGVVRPKEVPDRIKSAFVADRCLSRKWVASK